AAALVQVRHHGPAEERGQSDAEALRSLYHQQLTGEPGARLAQRLLIAKSAAAAFGSGKGGLAERRARSGGQRDDEGLDARIALHSDLRALRLGGAIEARGALPVRA